MESSLVMTSDDILEMNEVPESLVIIGGGVVGIELGQAFMTFGSKVTVIEMMDRIVPAMDAEVSKNLRLILGTQRYDHLDRYKTAKKSLKKMANFVSRLKEKTISLQIKLFFQSVVFQTLKESVKLSLNWIVDVSRSMNTWKHLFQVSTHQVTSTVLRCWLTLPSVWVKLRLKMPLREIMLLLN